jgi:hypothetical protein
LRFRGFDRVRPVNRAAPHGLRGHRSQGLIHEKEAAHDGVGTAFWM